MKVETPVVNDTIRRFQRCARDAFRDWPERCIGIEGPVVIPTRPPWWARLLRRLFNC